MSIAITDFIGHPERLDKDTLYALRELVARHPYYQAARLMFLQNLFLLHDPTFGEELRRAALYIPNRNVLFNMVEADNYKIAVEKQSEKAADEKRGGDRTQTLIEEFLSGSRPAEAYEQRPRRKLTAADATTDYVAYLMQMEDAEPEEQARPQERSQSLIDDFIGQKNERLVLQETPEYVPEISEDEGQQCNEEDYFTETLAKIYIKQGRYEKALEIISKLSLIYPKKNCYFADQIRFLRKLIINNNNKR